MALFCLSRARPLDRALTADHLTGLADLVWLWFHQRSAGPATVRFAADVYAFARHRRELVVDALAARLPAASVDAVDPDTVRVSGPRRPAADPADVAVWLGVLADPAAADTCVLLRVTFVGPVTGFDGRPADGTSTLVLCGAPAADGALLLKAVWPLGRDESMHAVYRGAAWDEERPLIDALDVYLHNRSADPHAAADLAARAFGAKRLQRVFATDRDAARVMRLIRRRADLPDDRRAAAFARRLASWSALTAAGALAAAAGWRAFPPALIGGLCVVGLCGPVAAGIAFRAGRRVVRYRTRMRAALGRVFASPIDVRQTDLSGDRTPTMLKAVAELEVLGARHVCDLTTAASAKVSDGGRSYVLGDAVVSVALMARTETAVLFPPRPVIAAITRFADGSRHVTLNRPVYRHQARRTVTMRCLPEEGSPADVVAAHRRHVDRRLAAGARAVPPAATAADRTRELREDHDEGRAAWARSPYSWGDAVHDAFKVCRREYLRD